MQLHHISITKARESLGVSVREIGGPKKNGGNKREVTKAKIIFLFVLFFLSFLFYLINCVCVFTSNKGNHEGAQLADNKISFSFFLFFVFHSLSPNVCVCVCVANKVFFVFFFFLVFIH
jgi:hypothetical protein